MKKSQHNKLKDNPSKKIKVAFVYRPCSALTSSNYFTVSYNFFMKALKHNARIEVTNIPTDASYDASSLKDKFDIILLFENSNFGPGCMPDEISNLEDLDIPVIARVGDPWNTPQKNIMKIHKKNKIDAYFGFHHPDLFYKYYPKDFAYGVVLFGLEPVLYENLQPYNSRIKNRILNSGAVASRKISSRLVYKLTKKTVDPLIHYNLRTKCNDLSYVDYTSTLQHMYTGDKYPLLLQKYTTAIAAMTTSYTTKYWEIPAAGCLTFMEVTEKNHGEYLGFVDDETAIFINEDNYKEKFERYLKDTDNPKWEKIANAGKEYALNYLNNDVAVNSLIDLMEKLL